MSNSIKQVYASIFMDDNALQLLVAEYYNSRFNVIRIDKVKLEGIHDFRIVEREKVINLVKDTVSHASLKLGATIKKVILVLPSLGFKRYPLRVAVQPRNGFISKKDVAHAVSSALQTTIDDSFVIVNSSIVKYYVNGSSLRRLPEKEACSEFNIDIDLLAADKEMCFNYVNLISEAGLEVLDITLNNFAICKESMLFEQSLVSNVVLLDIGNDYSYLSLVSKGKLASSELVYDGMNSIYNFVKNCYELPNENIDRIVKYNVDYASEYPDDAVYAWVDAKGENQSISIAQLSKAVKGPTEALADKLVTMSKPIIESGNTTMFIVGEGSKMPQLVDAIKSASKCEVKAYYPDTIGVRDASLCALYGALFAYKEKAMLNDLNVCCVDMAEYENTVDQKKVEVDGESITSKIVKMFEMYRDEEEK